MALDRLQWMWCPERGSNPHAPFQGRRILSPLRLPVSPSGLGITIVPGTKKQARLQVAAGP